MVAVVVMDDVVGFDLCVPSEVFGRVRLADGGLGYELRVCGPSPVRRSVRSGGVDIRPGWGLDGLDAADLVVVPGMDPIGPAPASVLAAICGAAGRGATVASICTGAFVLAATGLLDGLRATTHWAAADELARRFPRVSVDPNVLWVDNGTLLTSAGAAAGIDLCLHLVQRDHGAAVAAQAARLSVMALGRAGGQAQFIHHVPPTPTGTSLTAMLEWLGQNLGEPISLTDMAGWAAMSERSFSRRFKEQTGTTPRRWLLAARVARAQELLETTTLPVEVVGERAGFGSTANFRARFAQQVGVPPSQYRRSFTPCPAHENMAEPWR